MIRDQIAEKMAEIEAYYGTDLYAHMVQLLKLLQDAYDEDLRTVTVENLRYKQGASLQVRLLRDFLIEPKAGDIPKA